MGKVCYMCGIEKEESEFYIIRPTGRKPRLQGKCKQCNNSRPRKTPITPPDKDGRTCRKCGIHKPFNEFHKNKSCLHGYEPLCKKCKHERRRNWEILHPEEAKDRDLRAKYKIGLSEVNAMLESQQGKCAICGRDDAPLVVDHNHATGKVRGMLCNQCNTMIGYCHESIDILVRGAAYLYAEQHPESGVVEAEILFRGVAS